MQERIRVIVEDEILSGIRQPGSLIDEKALAADFNTSRTPVREAMLVLATEGLVHIAPRSGTFVRRASASELIANLEALCELESAVARLAAKRATPVQRLELEQAVARTTACAEASDRNGYQAANTVLHEAIYKAAGNPVLVRHVRSVRKALAAYRQRGFDEPGRLATSAIEHQQVVAAICAGSPTEAEQAMRLHINVGSEAMAALVRAADSLNE
ncbi:GntR family transcriptional regulator [Pusillimonas sp. ANT_WB101]|uniref:GntR family transcriptional regulator n=1 Tax=Pusillimonas sp. ANT_WB101 TaxID=2597356 RepID=UPI0021027AC4|nr:GntR family transcriptional regulator [Pusillimonas sp. ANT_WB101]